MQSHEAFIERAELTGYVRAELSKEVNNYLAVASERRSARVGAAGNTLNTDENAKRAEPRTASSCCSTSTRTSAGRLPMLSMPAA